MNDERRVAGNRLSSLLGLVATLVVVIPTASGVALSSLASPLKILIVVGVWVVMGVLVHWLTGHIVQRRSNELARNRAGQQS